MPTSSAEHELQRAQVLDDMWLVSLGPGRSERRLELLRKGLVQVLASDAHNLRGRPPRLAEAVEACVPFVGETFARSMVLG